LAGVACCFTVRRRSIPALQFIPAIVPLIAFAASARADIYQWEYINPADPSQGKRQSTTLAPGGGGVDAVPGADLSERDLTMGYLVGAALMNANGFASNLTNADLSQANLADADFYNATVTNADFSGAEVRGARFLAFDYGTVISLAQLYSTASYQTRDLTGIAIGWADLSGAEFTGQNLTKAKLFGGITAANFTNAEVREARFDGMTLTQLYSTASYKARDLTGIELNISDLTGGNFVGQNLSNANLATARLTDAEFTNAHIRGANFSRRPPENCGIFGCHSPPRTGITVGQLYSTASYKAGDLSGVNFDFHNFIGTNFAGQNLTNVSFSRTNLTGADFTAADTRGVLFDCVGCLSGVDFTNSILNRGHIPGLDLDAGRLLVIRDYDGNPSDYSGNPAPSISITVNQHLTMGSGGTLRMVFEADAWDSTISFAPGIPVTLAGTLALTFADDVNVSSQLGRTLQIFDWTGVDPTGTFTISSPYTWDLSALYTTGEVTLIVVPEPSTLAITALGLLGLVVRASRPLQRIISPSKSNEELHAVAHRR
jgi:uncharacterized protein YjbI with pentapeptide repeats